MEEARTHTHAQIRCLTVIRDGPAECAVETRPHLRQRLTTATCNHTRLAIKIITSVDCANYFLLFNDSAGEDGGVTESIIAFE